MVTTLLEQDLFYRIVPLYPWSLRRQDLNPVDESWPCDQSVINGLWCFRLRHQSVDDRSQLGLAQLGWSHGCLTGSNPFLIKITNIFFVNGLFLFSMSTRYLIKFPTDIFVHSPRSDVHKVFDKIFKWF